MKSRAFQAAVLAAMDKSQRDREERERCPVEEDGCGLKGALCTVSKRGMKLGAFCPSCGWSSFLLRGRRVVVEMRRGANVIPSTSLKKSSPKKRTPKARGKKSTS